MPFVGFFTVSDCFGADEELAETTGFELALGLVKNCETTGLPAWLLLLSFMAAFLHQKS
jgi:hypothetical protein